MAKINPKKLLINLGKIAISILLLYFVFQKIPFQDITEVLQRVNVFWLILGSLFFLFSQIASTKRLELYLKAQQFNLHFRSNLELYFLGMFYNFFIPGGIGGDAYKIYILNKNFNWSAKKLTSSLFNDRLSGLLGIFVLIGLLLFFLFPSWMALISFVILSLIGIGYLLIIKIFPIYQKIYFRGLGFSLLIQGLQVFSFVCILKSLHIEHDYVLYSILFLASSVLSLISFAGIGVREMLFLQTSKLFQFQPEILVSASLIFSAITAFFSLLGLIFQIRNLHLKTE